MVKPSFIMFLKYFFLNEEKFLGLIIIISIVMFVMLVMFFSYHLSLATANETTNESFKREYCLNKL